MKRLRDTALEKNNLTGDDINLLISHQANLRIIEAIAKRLNLQPEKVFVNIERYGNTSSASIPIALDEANRQHRMKKNDLILLECIRGRIYLGLSADSLVNQINRKVGALCWL